MKSVKMTVKEFEKVLRKVGAKSLDACGTYIIGDFRIDVRKTAPLTGSERVSLLYRRRKEQGLCVVCGKKVTKKNPRNGKLYRLCETHRTKIDRGRER